MAAIGFLSQNITFGCLWGSFSVLLAANEARYGVDRQLSTLAIPAIMVATALLAPVAGMLATRMSLRVVMLLGTLLTTCGYLLLSAAPSYPIYLLAFALLLGPGHAVAAVLPLTLVSRWFKFNSGRVLGLVAAPIVVTFVPLIASWTLQNFGLAWTYRVLAAMAAMATLSCLFIVDQPPGTEPGSATEDGADEVAEPVSMASLLAQFRYWAVIVPAIAATTGSMILTAHMVPMFQSWGLSLALAASLLSVQSFVGIFGTVFFGWLADKFGGARTMLLVVVDSIALWLILLLQPPFMFSAPLIGLIGFHGSGVVPVLGVMLNEAFGRKSFSGAYGLMNLITLPFGVFGVPAAAMVYAQTGSYAWAILGEVAFLALGAMMLLVARAGSAREATCRQPSH